MQNVLIIGENSYIGNSFESFSQDKFNIKKISSRENTWENADFSWADCVLYCAGIVHRKAESSLYFEVNRDLAVDIAEKAKNKSTSQFIYLSTAAVYEKYSGELNADTMPNPVNPYGKSKLEAENKLKILHDNNFTVTIIRPPMVYGPDCKGNFQRLVKLAKISPVVPDIKNKRSMIYIENLCFFLLRAVENRLSGVFFPQNAEYVNTTELFQIIRKNLNKNTYPTKIFNPLVYFFMKRVSALEKLFGDFAYKGAKYESIDYIGFEESVKKSVTN